MHDLWRYDQDGSNRRLLTGAMAIRMACSENDGRPNRVNHTETTRESEEVMWARQALRGLRKARIPYSKATMGNRGIGDAARDLQNEDPDTMTWETIVERNEQRLREDMRDMEARLRGGS